MRGHCGRGAGLPCKGRGVTNFNLARQFSRRLEFIFATPPSLRAAPLAETEAGRGRNLAPWWLGRGARRRHDAIGRGFPASRDEAAMLAAKSAGPVRRRVAERIERRIREATALHGDRSYKPAADRRRRGKRRATKGAGITKCLGRGVRRHSAAGGTQFVPASSACLPALATNPISPCRWRSSFRFDTSRPDGDLGKPPRRRVRGAFRCGG